MSGSVGGVRSRPSTYTDQSRGGPSWWSAGPPEDHHDYCCGAGVAREGRAVTVTFEHGHIEFGARRPSVVSTFSGYVDLTSPGGVTRRLAGRRPPVRAMSWSPSQRPDLFRPPKDKGYLIASRHVCRSKPSPGPDRTGRADLWRACSRGDPRRGVRRARVDDARGGRQGDRRTVGVAMSSTRRRQTAQGTSCYGRSNSS